MLALLRLLARQGRFVLVAGLVAGLLLPQVATALRPWLGELVLVLLFLNAVRIGLPEALRGLRHSGQTLRVVLCYQLLLPMLILAGVMAAGFIEAPAAIALTLMLAAPPVTAAPNMSVMLGHAPEPAFRLLILGTLIVPLTILPIFWMSPALGDWQTALDASLRLGLSLCGAVVLGFMCRSFLKPRMSTDETQALDGVISLTLAILVIGLMSAVAPALAHDPIELAGWLLFAVVANLGAQLLAYVVLRRCEYGENAVPFALVAGNRNVALFLIASSVTQSEEFLMFLGCYQFPMYLTPLVMRPLFGRDVRA